MMRWLKEKKKEKRSNSSSHEDDGEDNDYGFGKEKLVPKFPSSKRELPPTPAAPEEKSPHIYEEIPDLSFCSTPDSLQDFLLQNSVILGKRSAITEAAARSLPTHLHRKIGSHEGDINPYNVVPVVEVRQTPIEFHRNGTPEVHCDVIVKDTHCEILLTRKPKISTDNAFLHASVDCQNAGKSLSAFSSVSSAFQPSSNSKANSAGGPSSVSFSSFSEHQQIQGYDEKDAEGPATSGVVTYTSASNLIPRSQKLIFKPLPGKDPCLEAFGLGPGDESDCTGCTSIRNEDLRATANSVNYSSIRMSVPSTVGITYTSIQTQEANSTPENHVTYSLLQEQQFDDTKLYHSHCYSDEKLLYKWNLKTGISNNLGENKGFISTTRTDMIRASSPSNSSTCTYASVTFPTEPKHYSTIPDLMSTSFPNKILNNNEGESLNGHNVYSSVNGSFQLDMSSTCDVKNSVLGHGNEQLYLEQEGFKLCDWHGRNNKVSCFDGPEKCNRLKVNGEREDSNCPLHLSISGGQTCVEGEIVDNNGLTYVKPPGISGNSIELEFCSCSDEHPLSCGCSDAKHNQDGDDVASMNEAPYSGPKSCRGCGRLIRQITYSESYSDETYEHVYASRLLIRKGRRFSSPDITLSEISQSEFQDIPKSKSPDFLQTFSRDDSFTSAYHNNAFPPAYNLINNSTTVRTSNPRQLRNDIEPELVGTNELQKDTHHGQILTANLLCKQNCFHVTDMPICAAASRSTSINPQKVYQSKDSINYLKDISMTLNKTVADSHAKKKEHFPEQCWDFAGMYEPMPEEQKSIPCNGLFAKFTRAKASIPLKHESSDVLKDEMRIAADPPVCKVTTQKCSKKLEEIPDKNTRRLSSFFQHLSSKEMSQSSLEHAATSDIQIQNSNSLAKEILLKSNAHLSCTNTCTNFHMDKCAVSSQKFMESEEKYRQASQGTLSFEDNFTNGEAKRENLHQRAYLATDSSSLMLGSASASDQVTKIFSSLDHLTSSAVMDDTTTKKKPPNKTDSGDTCYEYDISTSSEGEQTSYESFLSKVKKTLNLEHEVQHIAESSAAQRKKICKHCKRDGLHSIFDEDQQSTASSDGFCPHLAAKFGDLRAFFEDLVVDQRAVILDSLTDYIHSPYNNKSFAQESHCRECGCELHTSDSESQATIYSLLSQQFGVTSPCGKSPSCESDEGTMADNSCESDDNENEYCHSDVQSKKALGDGGSSSGYDEAGHSEQAIKKSRKKEKREKRCNLFSDVQIVGENCDQAKKMVLSVMNHVKNQQNASDPFKVGSVLCDLHTSNHGLKDLKDLPSESSHKYMPKKSKFLSKKADTASVKEVADSYSSVPEDPKVELDQTRICDLSKSRPPMVTGKVLQDIYAPLPPKALSLITSRNYSSTTSMPCMCSKGRQGQVAVSSISGNSGKNMPSPISAASSQAHSVQVLLSHITPNINHEAAPPGLTCLKENKHTSTVGKLFKDHNKKDARKSNVSQLNSYGEIHRAHFACTENMDNKLRPQITLDEEENHVTKERTSEETTKTYCEVNLQSPVENNKCHTSKSCLVAARHAKDNEFVIEKVGNQEAHVPLAKHSGEVVTETSNGSEKINIPKISYTRKHRLELATLDLLPETALGGDAVDCKSEKLKTHSNPLRIVEKMTRLFESFPDRKNMKMETVQTTFGKQESKKECTSKDGCKSSGKGSLPIDLSRETTPLPGKKRLEVKASGINIRAPKALPRKSLLDKAHTSSKDQCQNIKCKTMKANEHSLSSHGKDSMVTSKAIPLASSAAQNMVPDSKKVHVELDKSEAAPAKNEPKRTLAKAASVKPFSHTSETRSRSQKSPTPSTSSASSSCSSLRRRGGSAKHRKLVKKLYHKRRSKSRIERGKKSVIGKEERTYYYFSSDFSDIDVVEVESWESYPTSLSQPFKKSGHKTYAEPRKSGMQGVAGATDSLGKLAKVKVISLNKIASADRDCYERQEVYSMPPSCAELRQGREGCVAGSSPQPSPSASSGRKGKKTDVYMTRTSDNKLLSDLIIRNYDMQVYGNV